MIKFEKKLKSLTLLASFAMSLLLILGCARAKHTPPPPPETPAKTLHVIQVGAGELVHYTQGAKRSRAWGVRWKTASLEFMDEGDKGGDMETVEGEIYKDDQVVSQYSAEKGHADRVTGVLDISGNVRVHSLKPVGDVTCDKLSWIPTKQVMIASGNVKIDQNGYTLQGVPEMWCSPDLKSVATPDLYGKQ